jgi:hypothetical protein
MLPVWSTQVFKVESAERERRTPLIIHGLLTADWHIPDITDSGIKQKYQPPMGDQYDFTTTIEAEECRD